MKTFTSNIKGITQEENLVLEVLRDYFETQMFRYKYRNWTFPVQIHILNTLKSYTEDFNKKKSHLRKLIFSSTILCLNMNE